MEEVYRSSRKECLDIAMMLETGGIHCEINQNQGRYSIVVAAEDVARARDEIGAYSRENRLGPTAMVVIHQERSGWAGVISYAAILALITFLYNHEVFANDWFTAGKMHAGAVRRGEVWRAITALTLHADMVHLIANIVIGGLVGLFAGQVLGSGLAWISILFGGAFGNLLNALLRPPDYTSIGASTAVFASLGLVAGFSWIRNRQTRDSMLARYASIVGAVVLLSLLGTSGEKTDVLSHVMGFISGLLLGAIYGRLGNRIMFGKGTQFLLGIVASAVLTLAWCLALT